MGSRSTPSSRGATPGGVTPSPGVLTVTFYDPRGDKKTVRKEVVYPFFYALGDYFEETDRMTWTMFMEMSVGSLPKQYNYYPPAPGEQHCLTYRRRKKILTCELTDAPETLSEMAIKVRQFIYETSGTGTGTPEEKSETEPELATWATIGNKPRLASQYLDAWVKRRQDELKLSRAEVADLWRTIDLLRLRDLLRGGNVSFEEERIIDIPIITYCPRTRTFATRLAA